jgi:hypothetical protein
MNYNLYYISSFLKNDLNNFNQMSFNLKVVSTYFYRKLFIKMTFEL